MRRTEGKCCQRQWCLRSREQPRHQVSRCWEPGGLETSGILCPQALDPGEPLGSSGGGGRKTPRAGVHAPHTWQRPSVFTWEKVNRISVHESPVVLSAVAVLSQARLRRCPWRAWACPAPDSNPRTLGQRGFMTKFGFQAAGPTSTYFESHCLCCWRRQGWESEWQPRLCLCGSHLGTRVCCREATCGVCHIVRPFHASARGTGFRRSSTHT